MKTYTFPYVKEYSALVGEIYRPIVRIYMKSKSGEWKPFDAYADSGADLSFFPRNVCMQGLGYDFEDGKPGLIGGVAPERIKVYIHSIQMRLGREEFKAHVAFADVEEAPYLLGRTDIFNRFKVCYDHERLETSFTTI